MKDQANPAFSKPGGQELGMRDPRARVAVSARWPARLHWRPPRPLLQGPTVRPDPVPRSSCFAFSQGFCCKDASGT